MMSSGGGSSALKKDGSSAISSGVGSKLGTVSTLGYSTGINQ